MNKPAPESFNCNVVSTDTLTVENHSDGDIGLFARDSINGEVVSIYLTPAEARKLRKALKRAIKFGEQA